MFFKLIWLIPVLPLLRLGKRAIFLIACGSVLLSMLIGFGIIYGLSQGVSGIEETEHLKVLPDGKGVEFIAYEWVPAGDTHISEKWWSTFSVNLGFRADSLSALMLFVVCFVGFVIHVYSIGYMDYESSPGYARYFAYLNLFMGSMLILVTASSYLLMFVGWEGVGLCSYLLIGFDYEKKFAADAGKKAFVVNRIGDAGFMIGMLLIFHTFGSLDFSKVFPRAEAFAGFDGSAMATAICLCLFLGACGKSAQIPLYVWLPDAMAGPTPVSALIHAATMVTSGIYMVSRSSALYLSSETAMLTVAIVGCATAFIAATIGLVQNDIKKVLAYSTVSQLGYMFLGCGLGVFAAGMFHLMTHAFFKALLFLGSGSVIHAMSGEKDIRKMGGLRKKIKTTWWTFLVGTVAIAGIPPLAGFFSKDEILWGAFATAEIPYGKVLWVFATIAAGFTAFYMFRLLILTFHGESRLSDDAAKHVHESPKVMTVPLMVLAAGAVVAGFVGIPKVLWGSNRIGGWLASVVGHGRLNEALEHNQVVEIGTMCVSLAVAICGILIAYYFYKMAPGLPDRLAAGWRRLYALLLNKYYVDEIYDALVVNPFKRLCDWAFAFDAWVVDGAVNGTAWATRKGSTGSGYFDLWGVDGVVNLIGYSFKGGSWIFRKIQTGFVENYALYIIAGLFVIVALFLFG
jgi:NADH-quinone oxidoreductase subunit L